MTDWANDERLRELDDYMARLLRVLQSRAASAQLCGLTATQAFILRHLDRHSRAKASDIAKAVGLSPGAITQVCDELVRTDMIYRERSETDRRVVHISISEAGRGMLDDIRTSRTRSLYQVIRLLGQDDAGEFIRLMGRVVSIIEDAHTANGSQP